MYEFEKSKLYKLLGDNLTDILENTNAFIAGGAITSIFCNRDINDIDIYVRSEEDLLKLISHLYGNYWAICHTNKSTTFQWRNNNNTDKKLIQIIHIGYFNKAEEIFDKFDFTVCMGAFDFKEKKFVLHKNFLKHNAQRLLIFNQNTSFPIVSALRVDKYTH